VKGVWLYSGMLGIAGFVVAACGGNSTSDPGPQAGSGGNAGSGAGGASGLGGGEVGGGGPVSGGASGCNFNGMHYESGTQWPLGCNTCFCEGNQVNCTLQFCPPASGGSGGAVGGAATVAGGGTGAAGAGGKSGQAGSGGEPNQCRPNTGGQLCVVAADGGEDLVVGAPLMLTQRVSGCYSSSCTKLVSSGCSAIGMDGKYAVSNLTCLSTEDDGGGCTADCGGAPTVPCDLGMTLTEGDYALSMAPYPKPDIRFHVPGHLPGGSLCIDWELLP